jgi:hypothetical protein
MRDHELVLKLRDLLLAGIMVRAGAQITTEVAFERANNLADQVTQLIWEHEQATSDVGAVPRVPQTEEEWNDGRIR